MNRFFIAGIIFILFSFNSSAQDTVLTFYNKELQIVRKKKEDGVYVKSVENGKFHYKENRTGKDVLQSQEWDTVEGNGNKRSHYIEYTSGIKTGEGDFQNGQKDGTWLALYQNGNKREKSEYVNGIRHGAWIAWHENGKESSTGQYAGDIKSGLWKSWFENGTLSSIVNFEDEIEDMIPEIKSDTSLYKMIKLYGGLFDEHCYWFLQSGDTAAIEIYEKGKLNSVVLYDSLRKAGSIPAEKYEIAKKARFNGDINSYLKSSIRYPDAVGRENSKYPIQGKIIAEFTITEDGSITDIHLIKDSGFFELDREVIRVVNETNGKWSPGLFHNVPAETKYLLPVTFQPGL